MVQFQTHNQMIVDRERLEIKRRFLIESPLEWYGRFKVKTSPSKRIIQTYLKEPHLENNEMSYLQVIMIEGNSFSKIAHTYTRKVFVSTGINKEFMYPLTQDEYRNKLFPNKDNSKHTIDKLRYKIPFNKRNFDLDVYNARLNTLVILEVEVKSMLEFVLLPPQFKIAREITDNKYYNERNTASIDSYSKPLIVRDAGVRYPRRCD